MGKQIKVQAVKGVYYGKIVDTPQGPLDLHKLYPAGSILMIDEDDFTDATKPIPGTKVLGSYRRVQDAQAEVPAQTTSIGALAAQVKAAPEPPKATVPAGRK